MTSFTLKIIAIIGMTANHAAYMFYPYLPFEARCVMFAVGGITFPVMAFLLVEGYHHTSNIRRYGTRLLIFALLAQVPFWLFLEHGGNVLFTLLLSLIILYLYDHVQNRGLFWLICLAIIAISYYCDWGVIGPVMILVIRIVPGRRARVILAVAVPVLVSGLPPLISCIATGNLNYLPFALYAFLGCTAAAVMLLTYNGQRGRPLKYFFYAYYPCHILVLGLVKGLLLGDWTLGY